MRERERETRIEIPIKINLEGSEIHSLLVLISEFETSKGKK